MSLWILLSGRLVLNVRGLFLKLWNAARFRQMQGGAVETEISAALLSSDDKWLLLRLNTAIVEVSTALEEYRFSDATATLYRFFWSEYCDWYVEASKAVLGSAERGTRNAERGMGVPRRRRTEGY